MAPLINAIFESTVIVVIVIKKTKKKEKTNGNGNGVKWGKKIEMGGLQRQEWQEWS